MRLFQSESIFNARTGQWEEIFWIDGIIVDPDFYFYELDREKEIETAKLLKEIEIEEFEDDYEYNECCGCYECVIQRYVDLLCEITGGCPCCIRAALESYCDEIVERIVIEDMEDNEVDEVDNEIEREMRRFN